MRADAFTVKVQEAIDSAQRLARERGHQALEPAHLLAALLEDEQGVTRALLEKLGVDAGTVEADVNALIERLPRVSGSSDLYLSNDLKKLLDDADSERERLKDDYVTVEHLLLAADRHRRPGRRARSAAA